MPPNRDVISASLPVFFSYQQHYLHLSDYITLSTYPKFTQALSSHLAPNETVLATPILGKVLHI